MALSSAGIGSGLDVNSIVSQLIAVDSQPLTTLTKKEASFQAKLSAIGSVKGALSSFQGAVRGLSDITKFQGVKVNAADASVVSASGNASAVPGTYALEVSQLAQAQKLATAGQASATAAIGVGTLSFDFGTITGGTFSSGKYTGASFASNASGIKTVTIDASNNSLAGIRDAINSAKIGVTATIVNDGSTTPNRLVLTQGTTGVSNSIKISVAGDAALSSLLTHDPAGTQGLTENISAQNALFKVDGIAVSKTANSVSDVINGVTLNLTGKTATGVTTNVTVARDSAAVAASVTQFVAAYNQINQTLTDVSSYNATTKQSAILNGDSAIRSIQAQLRGVLNAPVGGGNSTYSVLSQIGVSVQKGGALALDSTKLQAAIDTNFSSISGLFAAVGKSTDSLITYTSATAKTQVGSYAVSVSAMATQGSATGLAPAGNGGSGSTTGSAAAGLTVDASNNTLNVLLDGVSSTVMLTQKTYLTATDLATEVQTQINASAAFSGAGSSATVSNSGGILKITSNKIGSSSAAQVTGGNGAMNLLGASPVVAAGFDTGITAGVNDTLTVQVDGVTNTITLAPGNYSFATLATALQGKINGIANVSGVSVKQTAGTLSVTSNSYGSQSSVTFTSGNALTTLFGGIPTAVAGANVTGTINNVAATGSGQLLIGATGDKSEGLTINVGGTALGARGTINYSQGYAFQFDKVLSGLLDSTGPLTARSDGINASIKSIEKSKTQLSATLTATEKRYRAQYTALDGVISSLQKTSSFLTQQLANLPKSA